MRVFLSYRREDTGGRAGRLHDSLVARLGAGRVFQDVGSIDPGVDFDEAIGRALSASDATLVVIGPEWSAIADADGRRRLEQPDDYVRREVAAALAGSRPVVPVLVDGSSLPSPQELPDDIRALAQRQAVTVSDAAWHDDVERLVRRLEGTDDEPPARRRRAVVVAGVVAALVAVAVAAVVISRQGDESSSWVALPRCSAPDASWTALRLVPGAAVLEEIGDAEGHRVRYSVSGADARPEGSRFAVLVRLELANETPSKEGTLVDDWYFSESDVRRLVVGGVAQGRATCFGLVSGDPELAPGQRAIALVGFASDTDPTANPVTLETRSYASVPVSG